MKVECLEKRGKCYYSLGKFQEALKDFEECNEINTS